MSDYSCNFATNKQFNHIRMKKKNIQTPVLSMAIAACMISHQQNAQAGENPSLQKKFETLGAEVVIGCTLVMLRTNQFN